MSVITRETAANRILIRNVSWITYESLLRDLAERSSPRLAYDRGVLEIMSPHAWHEAVKEIISLLVQMTLEEMAVDHCSTGSTTFKNNDEQRGCEPDASFYIKNVVMARGRGRLDMAIDPPPDLAIEVDLTSDSLDKLPLYASIGVPEVWRYRNTLEIWVLQHDRTYMRQSNSMAIGLLDDVFVSQLVESGLTQERPAWLQDARRRIRGRSSANR